MAIRATLNIAPSLTGTLSAAARVPSIKPPTPSDPSDPGTTVTKHNELAGRDEADAHPMSAITDLEETLDDMKDDFIDSGDFVTEQDILDILNS